MLVPWFDVDGVLAEVNALSRQILDNRGLDGRHGLRSAEDVLVGAGFVDRDGAWVWTSDLPGVSKDDLKVTVENGVLTIAAKRALTVPEGRTARHGERLPFDVRRSLALPESVDVDGIAASLDDGVLTLRLPKKPRAQPRSIQVRVE